MIIPANLAAASAMDGFKNYNSVNFSVVIPGQTLASGTFISATANTPLNRSNSISQVQLQYAGLSSEYYIVNGSVNTFWSGGDYEIESYYYFDTTNLNLFTILGNQTAGNITIPTITINCRGFLFLAPF